MSYPPSALLTDLYQLTMAHAYFELGMHETAVFELVVRRLPRARRFLVAAGLEQVVEYLEELRFTEDDVAFLRTVDVFRPPFCSTCSRYTSPGRSTPCLKARRSSPTSRS